MPNTTPQEPPDGAVGKFRQKAQGLKAHDHAQFKDRPFDAFAQLCANINDFKQPDQLLDTIARLIPRVIPADGGAVLLWDRRANALVVKAVDFHHAGHAARFEDESRRFGKTTGDRVFDTGSPMIVNDYQDSSQCDQSSGKSIPNWIFNRADVPLKTLGRKVGVLSAINKKEGDFIQSDVDLLASVAGVTALAMENIRIRESLAGYYRQMKDFNRAKDRVIHQISHALKTPLAVLMASLKLLRKPLNLSPDTSWLNIYDRAQRNLARLLTIEYEMEDILRQRQDDSGMVDTLSMAPDDTSTFRSDEDGHCLDDSEQNGGKI